MDGMHFTHLCFLPGCILFTSKGAWHIVNIQSIVDQWMIIKYIQQGSRKSKAFFGGVCEEFWGLWVARTGLFQLPPPHLTRPPPVLCTWLVINTYLEEPPHYKVSKRLEIPDTQEQDQSIKKRILTLTINWETLNKSLHFSGLQFLPSQNILSLGPLFLRSFQF